MDTQQLIDHANRLVTKANDPKIIDGVYSEITEFLRMYAPPKSEFLASIRGYNPRNYSSDYAAKYIREILRSFVSYVEEGLLEGLSPERRAQIDVVSDFLEQSQSLLNSSKVHPAAPIVLIGAALEEFLRNWVEANELSIGNRKPGLNSYATVLRESDQISKQDVKDITSWSGLRNHAAHGDWDFVSDRNRATLMLEGVNLFMRKYGA